MKVLSAFSKETVLVTARDEQHPKGIESIQVKRKEINK